MNLNAHQEIIIFHKPNDIIDAYMLNGGFFDTLKEAQNAVQDTVGQLYVGGFFHPAFASTLNQFKCAVLKVTVDDDNNINVNNLFTKSKDQDWIEYPISNLDLTTTGQEIILEACNALNTKATSCMQQ
jgi:hypothetical protein